MTSDREQDTTQYSQLTSQRLELSLDSLDPNLPIHEITKKLLGHQLATTIENIPGIHANTDIESVHKTRVGFRRIRSQLRILKPLFKKRYLNPLRSNSQQIGQALGAVRDLDVLQLNLSSDFQFHDHPGNFHETIWKPLFLDQYQIALDKLLKQLESRQFSEFIQSFHYFCQTIEIGAKKPEKIKAKGFPTLKSYVTSMLFSQLQNARMRHKLLLEQPSDTNFHKLRIDVKRFRYTLDFFNPILKSAPTLDLINSLTSLQDTLGIINDNVTAEQIINPILEKPPSFRDSTLLIFLSEYRNKISIENETLQAGFQDNWKSFQDSNPEMLLQDCFSEIRI